MPIYRQEILAELGRHGLAPVADTTPGRLRDAVRDLYKYEIRRLRDRVVRGDLPKDRLADHVIELRRRYWLLSVPTELWVESENAGL